jgi:signal transduction histidine kinase
MNGQGARGLGPPRAVVLLVTLGVLLAVVGEVLVSLSTHPASTSPTPVRVLHWTGGLAYLGLALYVGWRRPANPIGLLLALVGVLWFATDLGFANDPRLFTLGLVVGAGPMPVYLHIAVAMPTGHLRTLAERTAVVAGYVVVFGFQIASWMVADNCLGVPDCPGNLLVVIHDPALSQALDTLHAWALVGLMGIAGVLMARRLGRAPRSVRPAMIAVLVAVLLQGYDLVRGLLSLPSGPWEEGFWWTTLESVLFEQTLAIAIVIWMVRYELDRSRDLAAAAADTERRRLERDLHDGAQQQLLGIAVDLDRLAGELDRGSAAGVRVKRATHRLHQAVADLRGLTRGDHPALDGQGIAVALERLADVAPLPVELGALPSERFPHALERAIWFLVSEAVANAAHHARATHVTIEVQTTATELTVTVHDDGVGGAATASGTGLRGLQERFRALDGDLTVHSPPGQGTTLVGRLPASRPAPA